MSASAIESKTEATTQDAMTSPRTKPPRLKETAFSHATHRSIRQVSLGPPDDDDSPDAVINTWAGVIPLVTSFGSTIASPEKVSMTQQRPDREPSPPDCLRGLDAYLAYTPPALLLLWLSLVVRRRHWRFHGGNLTLIHRPQCPFALMVPEVEVPPARQTTSIDDAAAHVDRGAGLESS
jgi:hypothetical protein